MHQQQSVYMGGSYEYFRFFLLLFVYDLTVLYLYAIDGGGGGGGGEEERMEIKTRNLGGVGK